MSRFYIPSASQSSSQSSSPRSSLDTELPFPAPLPRSDFLTQDFTPATYLSEVAPHRHQVLEDLRTDLRTRSQQLSRELLDLVNAHYVDFLGLGTSLRGGNEKIQELRVGLMGFQRELEAVCDVLVKRETEIKRLINERRWIRNKLELGKALLSWEERLCLLEDKLNITRIDGSYAIRNVARPLLKEDEKDADGEEFDEEDTEGSVDELDLGLDGIPAKEFETSLTRLSHRVNDYEIAVLLTMRIGLDHPFVKVQQHRIVRIRKILLLDLGNCLKDIQTSTKWKLRILAMYRRMDASEEAVEAFRSRPRPPSEWTS